MITLLIQVGIVLTILLMALLLVASRLKIASANEALVVSGAKQDGAIKVVQPGGKVFVIPVIQKSSRMSLEQIEVPLAVSAFDANAIPVTVEGVAMVKIGSDPVQTRAAAERFLHQQAIINDNAQEILNGTLRAIIGQMTVESLIKDRALLSEKVSESADSDLKVMGLIIDSLQIKEISDFNGYIEALGVPEVQSVQRQARIATAEANKQANQAEAASQRAIAEQNKELFVRQAELKAETDRAQADANAAGPIRSAERQKVITESQQEVAEQRALLRERELDSEVRKPADASRYQAEKDAEAKKYTSVAEAQATAEATRVRASADAEAVKLRGEAEAAALRAKGQAEAEILKLKALAEAESLRAKGDAEAEVLLAKGKSEAEAMQLKADAYRQYNDAAVLQLIIDRMPDVARELAAPMSAINDMTVISTDGASALTRSVATNFEQLDKITESLTGTSLSSMAKGFLHKAGDDPADGSA